MMLQVATRRTKDIEYFHTIFFNYLCSLATFLFAGDIFYGVKGDYLVHVAILTPLVTSIVPYIYLQLIAVSLFLSHTEVTCLLVRHLVSPT
ncbi:hypothetical protein GGS20DRAFT_543406 [Poronia punctata]|nr:hypothetical protein GGS20DRAFT_543406 [Poronia punctata]